MINNPAGISSSYMRQWDRALGSGNVLSMVKVAILPLASLRLTVTLFSMTLFLVWVGTVAQQDKGMWQVIQNYFHCWVAWIEFGSVFPRAFFQSSPAIYEKIAPSGGFFFPGGISLGLALFVNLIAAHAVRFQSVARGKRLVAGIAAMAVAFAICIIVILSGHSQSGLQGKPPMEWTTLWQVMKTTLVLLWLATSVVGGVHWYKRRFPMTLGPALAVVGCLVWGSISLALLISQTQISASSMRILW